MCKYNSSRGGFPHVCERGPRAGGPARELRAGGAVSVGAGGGEPARARGPVGALPDR